MLCEDRKERGGKKRKKVNLFLTLNQRSKRGERREKKEKKKKKNGRERKENLFPLKSSSGEGREEGKGEGEGGGKRWEVVLKEKHPFYWRRR